MVEAQDRIERDPRKRAAKPRVSLHAPRGITAHALARALYTNFTASNAGYKTWDINIAAVYCYAADTNMAAVTSCENPLYPIVLGCPSIIL